MTGKANKQLLKKEVQLLSYEMEHCGTGYWCTIGFDINVKYDNEYKH